MYGDQWTYWSVDVAVHFLQLPSWWNVVEKMTSYWHKLKAVIRLTSFLPGWSWLMQFCVKQINVFSTNMFHNQLPFHLNCSLFLRWILYVLCRSLSWRCFHSVLIVLISVWAFMASASKVFILLFFSKVSDRYYYYY